MNKVVINKCYGGFGVSKEATQWMIDNGLEEKYYDKDSGYFYSYLIPRHHPLLVQAVEKFEDKANGFCAELEVVEIEGNLYRIDEYDGWEDVKTPDDINWIII